MKPFPKDVNIEIMNRLDDKSLGNFCRINPLAKKICDDENFWRNRIYIIFKNHAVEVLKNKKEGQTYKDFYTSKDFQIYRDKIYPLCEEIRNFPHESQLVIDDFYNPDTGFVPKGITRNINVMKFLLLKIVLQKMKKDFEEIKKEEKLEKIIKEIGNQINDWEIDEIDLDTFELTTKEREFFYKLIDITLTRNDLIKTGGKVKPDFFRYAKNAPENYKLILHIHDGFRQGKLPLDIKWEELCTHPYLYIKPEINLN